MLGYLRCVRSFSRHQCEASRRAMTTNVQSTNAAGGPVLGCTVYISEGRNLDLIDQFESIAAKDSRVVLVNKFVDEPYHRTSFTLASLFPSQMAQVAVSLAKSALQTLDLRGHKATHPRLGVVDHISCHPLSEHVSLEGAAMLAHNIAKDVGKAPHEASVLLYGSAEKSGRRLDDLRRSFGYFKSTDGGVWDGGIGNSAGLQPDYGPATIDASQGIVAIGAIPWITNFNVVLESSDLSLAKRISRAVSERGGGLPAVQAMGLFHDGGFVEVACNLVDYQVSSPELALKKIEQLAQAEGTQIRRSYQIGKTPEQMASMVLQAK